MTEQLNNSSSTTLSAAITTTDATTATVTNGTLFPSSGNFRILVDTELMLVGARSGNNLSSITRGIEGTTAATHSNGATVTHLLTKAGLDQYLTENYSVAIELGYTQFTSNASITATTEGTAQTIVAADAIVFDGSTIVWVEFFAPTWAHSSTTGDLNLALFDNSTSVGTIWRTANPSAASLGQQSIVGKRRLTPSAASHTYSIRGYVDTGTGTVVGGTGGAALDVPGFILITKVI